MNRWRNDEADSTLKAGGELESSKDSELERLRKENKQLRQEREILKKAASFFAKESI